MKRKLALIWNLLLVGVVFLSGCGGSQNTNGTNQGIQATPGAGNGGGGSTAPAGTPLAMDADRVWLEGGAFSARVQSKLNATDFVVDNLPGNLGNAPVAVRTNGATLFWLGSDFATLNVGDTVSLNGFLLKSANGPVLLAEVVRKR